jgi:methylenetetrahydrofolate reductase (NADPH)
MVKQKTGLQERIESGRPILLAEVSPPKSADAAVMRGLARRYAGKVHALGVADNRDGVCMSALVAASLAATEGVEPILHVTTRDRNRIALASDCLGAQAMGIRNLLCTTGAHQTLGHCRNAKSVFDLDPVQLIGFYRALGQDASLVGEERFDTAGPLCLGATASPAGDPLEMQVIRLAKAVTAGATYVITQPVFNVERFEAWWSEVTRRGLHEKVAVIAGILPLANAESAQALAGRRPAPMIPQASLERLSAAGDKRAQRAAGIEMALGTIKLLSGLKGLRGFEIRGDADPDIALELIEKSGLGTN